MRVAGRGTAVFADVPRVGSGGGAANGDVGEYASYCARMHDEEIYHDLCAVKAARDLPAAVLPPAFNTVCALLSSFFLYLLVLEARNNGDIVLIQTELIVFTHQY